MTSSAKGSGLRVEVFFGSAVSAIHRELLCLLVPTNPRGWFPDLSAGSSLSDVLSLGCLALDSTLESFLCRC